MKNLLSCGFCLQLRDTVTQPGGLCANCQSVIEGERRKWTPPGKPATGTVEYEVPPKR
jgi:hypothetical protein